MPRSVVISSLLSSKGAVEFGEPYAAWQVGAGLGMSEKLQVTLGIEFIKSYEFL